MRTLVVGDSSERRALLVSEARARGHGVVACEDAASAGRQLPSPAPSAPRGPIVASSGPDATFDIVLFGLAGARSELAGFARALRAAPGGKRARLVAVGSGAGGEDGFDRAQRDGADDFLFDVRPSSLVQARLAILEERIAEEDERLRSERALIESEARARLVYGIARGLTSGASVRDVIRRALDETAAQFPHLRVTYATIDSAGKMVNLYSAGNAAMPALENVESDISVAPAFLAALRRGERLVNADITLDPRYAPIAAECLANQARAVVDIPLRHSAQLLGLVCFDHADVYRWSDHEVATLTSLADFLAVAVSNAQAEERMLRAQKLESLGVLAGGIAHDFNNLLVGILGNAGLALNELAPHSAAHDIVKRIETAALRAADLTRQLLAYSGKGRFVVLATDLNRIVEEMGTLLETVVSKRVALRWRLAPALPAIEADPTQLRQVVMNLITNASEAIGERDGTITIATGVHDVDAAYLAGAPVGADAAPGPYVFVEVSDDGCGMDEATVGRIFDPFFTTKFTGRGLGLAGVLGIVRGHRGAMRVHSEPGRGSTFRALFPSMGVAAPPEPSVRPAERVFKGTGLVLVVDDDEGVRMVARETCLMAGFEVEEARDGAAALARFRARPDAFAAVVLDMTMPVMDGEECFRELRRVRADVRVILSSGYDEQDATSRFAGKGLAAFIQKPYLPDELIEKLRAVIERRPLSR